MPLSLRIASFNFENFFSRATILNRDDAKMKPHLEDLAALEVELGRVTYDKPKILVLYKRLKPYIIVRENKGKLLSSATSTNVKVVASGAAGWEGWIEPRRERINDAGQENTVRVLKAVDADVVCVVEMEDRLTLQMVGKQPLLTKKLFYNHAMLIEGNDERGINVGLLSRHPITDLVSHIDDEDAKGYVFSRDCLETKVELPGGRELFVLSNHLKSQGYGPQASNDEKRRRQTEQIAKILKKYNLAKQYVVVAGDMNADRHAANGPTLAPLLNNQGLIDIIEQLGVNSWTYAYRGQRQRLDYLFCSKALAARLKPGSIGIERRGMWNLAKLTNNQEKPFPQVKDQKSAASDHAAVFADFVLP